MSKVYEIAKVVGRELAEKLKAERLEVLRQVVGSRLTSAEISSRISKIKDRRDG